MGPAVEPGDADALRPEDMNAPYQNIVILTGAGISAESGLGTFREKGGLWERFKIEDYATPEAFARQPDKVHGFYNLRRQNLLMAEPHDGHRALARLQKAYAEQGRGRVTLVTQNIDDLHEQAGSPDVWHMHGELLKARCAACQDVRAWREDLSTELVCGRCGREGRMRPHVVWFGEMPFLMDETGDVLSACDLFIAIGTSGSVYPAAGFVQTARQAGAHTVELNLEPSDGDHLFAERHYGPASEVVPAFVARVLDGLQPSTRSG